MPASPGLLEERAHRGDLGQRLLERLLEARRERPLRGDRESARQPDAVARQKAHQRRVLLVEAAIDVVGVLERRGQDDPDDLPLLVAEEQAQRVDVGAEVPVDEPQRLGQVRRGKGAEISCTSALVLGLAGNGDHAAGEVVVAQMEDAEDDPIGLLGDRRRDPDAPQRAAAPGRS